MDDMIGCFYSPGSYEVSGLHPLPGLACKSNVVRTLEKLLTYTWKVRKTAFDFGKRKKERKQQ